MILAGLILLVGVGAWMAFFSPWKVISFNNDDAAKKSLPKQGMKPETQGHIYQMDPFVVNLADPGQFRYLKIKLDIESNEPKENEEYGKRLPQFRDAILTILSSKSYQDIIDAEGKKKLREEIINKLNQATGDFKVKAIYFTEFVIQ